MSRFMRTLLQIRTLHKSSRLGSTVDELNKMKLKQMSEYYSQYIEEYDVVDEKISEVGELDVPVDERKYDELMINDKLTVYPGKETLEEISALLEAQRANDVVFLQISETRSPYQNLIIASPYNPRHSNSLVEAVRKYIKVKNRMHDTELARRVKEYHGWYVFSMDSMTLHVMTNKNREYYDLEGLWATEDPEDDSINPYIPPKKAPL